MLVSTILSLILPVTALASPGRRERLASASVSEALPPTKLAMREAREAGLVARKTVSCAIVHVSTTVNCRYHADTSSDSVKKFKNGSKHDFDCYADGDCVEGNCSWDYIPADDCFVSGYYTDDHCTKAALGKCGFS